MRTRGIFIRLLLILALMGLFLGGIVVIEAAAFPPTLSIINPKPGTLNNPTPVSLSSAGNNFKIQVQVWNEVADITNADIGYYAGTTPDSGIFTWVPLVLNSRYNCGTNCGIYEVTLSLAPGNYYLLARAVSAANGTGYSRDNRTGDDARYLYIKILTAKTGTGMLLARDASNQLCMDCHNLKNHSSQTTDTKYGNWQTVCLDCHTSHNTTNIHLIKKTITTPNSGNKTVRFYNTAGDAVNSYADSVAASGTTGVCQVCHTQTQGLGGIVRWRNAGNADSSHYQTPATQKCTSCHSHAQGFRGSCDACHNSPPTTGKHSTHFGTGTASYGDTSLQSNAAAYSFNCGTCHQGTHINTGDQSNNPHPVETLFAGIAIQDLKNPGPAYTASAPAVDDPGKGWTFNYSDGTCANTYCHGNYPGSGKITSLTFNTGTAPCSSCHEASNTTTPNSGSHARHAGSSYYTNYNCSLCHKDLVAGSGPSSYTLADKSKHVNGYVDWKLDTADSRISTSSTYSIPTGTAMPSDGTVPRAYGTCSSLYCHSIAQTSTGGPLTGLAGEYQTPTWGVPFDRTTRFVCDKCHLRNPLSGSHPIHSGYASGQYQIHCNMCHYNNSGASTCNPCHLGHTSEMYSPNTPLHVNREANVSILGSYGGSSGAVYNGSLPVGDGFSNCSNVYCHSNGTSVSTGIIPANTSPNWGSGTMACNGCHSYPPAYPNGNPKANSHSQHSVYTCNQCHYTTTNNGTAISNNAVHSNKSYNVDPGSGTSFIYSFNVPGGTCSTISCHGNGNATWGTSLALACNGCHDCPPPTASHLKHYGGSVAQAGYGDTRIAKDFSPNATSYIMNCGNCHPLDPARHGSGAVELYNPLSPAGSLKSLNPSSAVYTPGATVFTDSRGFTYTNGTCSNVYCHSSTDWQTPGGVPESADCSSYWPPNLVITRNYQTVTWGGSTLTCSGCHANPPRSVYPANDGGAANSHSWIDNYGYDNLHTFNMGFNPISCRYCHNDTVTQLNTWTRDSMDVTTMSDVPISNFSTHVNGINDVGFDRVNTFTYNTVSYGDVVMNFSDASYDASTKTCSNVSCHSNPPYNLNQPSVKWGTPYRWESSIECDRCHKYYGLCP